MNKISDPKLFAGIKEFLTVYLPRVRSRSENTIQAYRDTINLYTLFLGSCKGITLHRLEMADFNCENILLFRDWLKTERGNSDSTRNQRVMCIRAFCKYYARNDALMFQSYSLMREIQPLPIPERVLEGILSVEEVKHLLQLPDATTRAGMRDRFYMALLYDTGCRNQELLDMTLGDVQLNKDGGHVNVIGKGTKFRITPLSQEAIAMFRQYAGIFHQQGELQKKLFYIARKDNTTAMSADNTARILNKYEGDARLNYPNIPHLHPHLFRHTRAMHMYQANVPLPLIGEWLGHSKLETTLIYAYADTAMKRAASEKMMAAKGSVFTQEHFKYKNDDHTIRKLYGLA